MFTVRLTLDEQLAWNRVAQHAHARLRTRADKSQLFRQIVMLLDDDVALLDQVCDLIRAAPTGKAAASLSRRAVDENGPVAESRP